MNYIKLLNTLGKLIKEGQIKSIDEAIQMVQKMGAQVDGLLKKGIENLFKTTKAREPELFKGWTPKVIEGGKGKKGVESASNWIEKRAKEEGIDLTKELDEVAQKKITGGKTFDEILTEDKGVGNLFKETKKADLPEGVNWKDTSLPVNPKVESFYDELVENAYKESKKTGRDVKTIIEETIDYKFTGNETGKEILDIIEKKFFKADGGRIGFKSGGRGRQDPMGGHAHQTAAEMRAAAPDQVGGGMNISHGGGGANNPPSKGSGGNLNISPVITFKDTSNPYTIENLGVRSNIGKLMAAGFINVDDLAEGNIDPTIAANLNLGDFNLGGIKNQDQTGIFASGNIGPVSLGGSYQDFEDYGTSKNIGAEGQLGNFTIGANYNFEDNPTVGLSYDNPDSGIKWWN